MAKNPKEIAFLQAKDIAMENLETIRYELDQCIREGMLDDDAQMYNSLLGIMDEASLVKNWDELDELITNAKTIEQDVAAWMSYHGRNTVAFPWPKRIS